jgi:hypothetical protein
LVPSYVCVEPRRSAGLCFCRETVAARPPLNDERPATPRRWDQRALRRVRPSALLSICRLCVAPASDEPAKLSYATAEPGTLRVATRGSGELPRHPSARPGEVGCGQALYEPGARLGNSHRRAPDHHPASHLKPIQKARYEAVGNRERRNSARAQQHNREHTTPLRGCGFWCLTARSDEPYEERAAMSWHSRPRQCGEVALQERAMIRGPEPYHPRGRMRHKCPENAGLVWPWISSRRPGPNAACASTGGRPVRPGALAQRWEKGPIRVAPGGSHGVRLGHLPKSPFQTRPYSGLGRKKALQTSFL